MKKTIRLNKFVTENEHLREMMALASEYKELFIECLIHGSYATNEQKKYSDFDGLLIARNSCFDNPEISRCFKSFIFKSWDPIYRIDPFQHHGWLIIKESDLSVYPQTYFPHELFEYSKSLMNDESIFDILLTENYDYTSPFIRIESNILRQLTNRPSNLYQLKCFLSEIMLLPCVYLQAKLRKGIYKKFSFEIARNDFAEQEWRFIDIATQIREIWDYDLSVLQEIIMRKPGIIFRKLTKHFIATKIPGEYEKYLTKYFYSGCETLVKLMRENLRL